MSAQIIPFARPVAAREPWLSKRQAAEHLGVGIRTIGRWQAERGLPFHRAGSMCRYKASELDRWIASQ